MSNFAEIYRLVALRVDRSDGRTDLTIRQCINDALKVITRVHDFDELVTLDTTNAFTVAEQKSYHIEDDLNLVRPKDIYSIRYMDEGSSRKLKYVNPRLLDQEVPYTEIVGSGKPSYYTLRGKEIELYRIPDDALPLYIQHSQWHATLTEDADEVIIPNIEDALVALAADMTLSVLDGGSYADWSQRAMQLLVGAVREEKERPDRVFVARPFSAEAPVRGEYWKDPFFKGYK